MNMVIKCLLAALWLLAVPVGSRRDSLLQK